MKSRLRFLLLLCLSLLSLAGCFGGGGSTFDWEVTPDRRTIAPGQQTTFAIKIKSKKDINSQVALRVEGVPTGATATFSATTLPSTADEATLTVTTTGAIADGSYTLRIFAQEEGDTSEQQSNVLLIVSSSGTDADFTLEVDPSSFLLDIEIGKTFTYFVRPLNNFTGTITTTLSGVPSHVIVSQAPTPGTNTIGPTGGSGGTFVLRMNSSGFAQPPVDITVTSTGGGKTHTGTIHLTFPL